MYIHISLHVRNVVKRVRLSPHMKASTPVQLKADVILIFMRSKDVRG